MARLPQPRFNLRQPKSAKQTLILLIFRFRGKRLVYSTGYSIHSNDWDSKAQRPIQQEQRPDLFLITRQLNDIAKFCTEIFIESDYGSISVDTFRSQLDYRRGKADPNLFQDKAGSAFFKPNFIEFMDRQLAEFKASGMKRKSIEAYEQYTNVLKVFAKEVRSFDYDDVDWDFRLELIDWLASRDISLNYGNKILKTLRQFLERAKRKKLHDNNAYQGTGWTVPAKKAKGELVILSPQELEQLYHLPLEGSLFVARDLFLIGAATGQRFSDYTRYTPANFYTTINGIPILSIISIKTSIPAKIPLNIFPWLIPVLERNQYTSPKMKLCRYNSRIREVCGLAGLDYEVLIVKQLIGRKCRIVKSFEKKYTQVSSHTCRRSFATNLYRMGYSLAQIMPMTGHSTESQLRQYIGIDDEMNAEEIALSIRKRRDQGGALIKPLSA